MFGLFRRFFWLVFGFALGVALVVGGDAPARKLVAQAYAPADVVDRWSDNVRSAVSEWPDCDAHPSREVELKSVASSA